MSKTDAPAPMDPTAREHAVGTASPNSQRTCWAIKTLVAEVDALFPETSYEVSDYDGRNTGLTVTFDLASLNDDDAESLGDLLALTDSDERVSRVFFTPDLNASVHMHSNPRTQDSRDAFGLGNALSVLAGSEDDEESMFAWVNEVAVFPGGSL